MQNSKAIEHLIYAVCVLVCLWGGSAYGDDVAGERMRVTIPILVVQESNSGKINEITLLLERDLSSSKPLFISVAEDTPMGSGDALRASIWQGAMTVGMLRKDALQGVRLTYEVQGRIDGPSAGSGMAAGLMAAMDGRVFPEDAVITGVILPDGSIGRVGGIHLKMMAAKQAGKKRVIVPQCLRFEYDELKQVQVDLKVLADTLGLEYIPVGTLQEAYQALFNESGTASNLVSGSVAPGLPEYMDDYFKDMFGNQMSRISELLNGTDYLALGLEEDQNPLFNLATDAWAVGRQAAEAGYIDVASEKLREGLAGGQAVKSILDELSRHDGTNVIATLQHVTAIQLKVRRTPTDLIDRWRTRGVSAATTTYMSDIATGDALRSFVLSLGGPGAKDMVDGETKEDAEESALQLELYRARLAFWVPLYYDEYEQRLMQLNGYFNDTTLTRAPSFYAAENLLFSAFLTTKSTFDQLLSDCSEDEKAKLYVMLVLSDPNLLPAFGDDLMELHRVVQLAEGDRKAMFSAVAVQVYVKSIADMNRWILLLGELDPEWLADGRMHIQRYGLLHRLLTTSRERAVQAIQECRDKSLPWIGALLEFRKADYARDDLVTDKTEVLAGYWKAAMFADAVLMQYAGGTEGENIRRTLRSTFVEVAEVLPGSQKSMRMLRPGDKIIKVDEIEVRSSDELVALVAAMPEGYRYAIDFMPAGSMKSRRIYAVGGHMLGLRVKNFNLF